MAPAGKAHGRLAGVRLFGAKIDPSTIDDGAPQPAGTAGESLRTRRAGAFRHRIFGTITAYVDYGQ